MTLAQERGKLIRQIKVSARNLKLEVLESEADANYIEAKIKSLKALYENFVKLDEEFISLLSEEPDITKAESQADEVYQIISEVYSGQQSNSRPLIHHPLLPKPSKFSGNYEEYLSWASDFQDASCFLTTNEKFVLLKNCTTGEAFQAIQPFLLNAHTETNFKSALKCLKSRFGNDDIISHHYLRTLDNWPTISNGLELQAFIDYLNVIKVLSGRLESLEVVNLKLFNKKLTSKLPQSLQDSWIEQFADYENGDKPFPSFSDFINYLEKKSFIMNHSHKQGYQPKNGLNNAPN